MIQDISENNLPQARAFLERHSESSLFLLSNLAELGPRLGESPNSANFRCVEEGGEVQAVFGLARRGNLLLQTGGRADLGAEILRACEGEPIQIGGVIGEWRAAESVWRLLRERPLFQPTLESRETLFRLGLAAENRPAEEDARVCVLEPADFDHWELLNTAYLQEEGLPAQGSDQQRRDRFSRQARAGHWWGAFDNGRLTAIAGLNAAYRSIGQVGGVYTPPAFRRRGLARAVMRALLRDSLDRHQLNRLILFTGEKNVAARALYESLGWKSIGEFGMLFGTWRAAS